MKLYVRTLGHEKYYKQSYNHPGLPEKSEIKPGDTLYSLSADYYVDKVEYSKVDVIVYATKSQIFIGRIN